jgi:hypothetical protein
MSGNVASVTVGPLRLAAGLSLLGSNPGDPAGDQFLVRRGDGQIVELAQLPYLVTEAVAEAVMATGALGGGVSAELVAAQVNDGTGHEITVATVCSLVASQLAPLGVVTTVPPEPASAPVPGPPVTADERSRGRHPRRRTLVLGAAVLAAGAGAAVAAVVVAHTGTASAPAPADQVRAAAWVAQQVSPGAVVSCDATMCDLLRHDGFPAARLKTLGPATRDPLGSAVVIATPTVRDEFGTRLATAYAPGLIASFGSGAARVEVRAIAPGGGTGYPAALSAQHTALASAGRQLLLNRTVQASPSARAALLAGRVDPRLLAVVSVLSSQLTVKLEAFGDAAPGAGPTAPLRSAQLSAASAAGRSAIMSFLDAQQGLYRPDMMAATQGAGGQPVVAVRFDAPAPPPTP